MVLTLAHCFFNFPQVDKCYQFIDLTQTKTFFLTPYHLQKVRAKLEVIVDTDIFSFNFIDQHIENFSPELLVTHVCNR